MKKRKRTAAAVSEDCAVCGTSALSCAGASDDKKKSRSGSVIELEPVQSDAGKADSSEKPMCEQTVHEKDNTPQPEKPAEAPSPEIQEPGRNTPEIPVIPAPQPEIQKPLKMEEEHPFGSSLRSDGKFSESPENSSGIIYEIAEQLYLREKTMSEIEALCRPPFRKVFSQTQLEELDRQAAERTKRLVSAAGASGREPVFLPDTEEQTHERPIGVGSAFLLQLVMMVPLFNIITALILSFGRGADKNMKAFSRAFLIWTVIFMTAALIYFAVFYFTNPVNHARMTWIMNMFRV